MPAGNREVLDGVNISRLVQALRFELLPDRSSLVRIKLQVFRLLADAVGAGRNRGCEPKTDQT